MAHASYLNDLIPRNFTATVNDMAEMIRKYFPTATAVAGRGLSGAMLVPALATHLGVEWIICRKGEKNHSSYNAEISRFDDKVPLQVVFVDDLIESGETLRGTMEVARAAAARFENLRPEFIGAALYEDEVGDRYEEAIEVRTLRRFRRGIDALKKK